MIQGQLGLLAAIVTAAMMFGQNRKPFSGRQYLVKGRVGVLERAALGFLQSVFPWVGFTIISMFLAFFLWIICPPFSDTLADFLQVRFTIFSLLRAVFLWVGFLVVSSPLVDFLQVRFLPFSVSLADFLWVGFIPFSVTLVFNVTSAFLTIFLTSDCRCIFLPAPLTDLRLVVVHVSHLPFLTRFDCGGSGGKSAFRRVIGPS